MTMVGRDPAAASGVGAGPRSDVALETALLAPTGSPTKQPAPNTNSASGDLDARAMNDTQSFIDAG